MVPSILPATKSAARTVVPAFTTKARRKGLIREPGPYRPKYSVLRRDISPCRASPGLFAFGKHLSRNHNVVAQWKSIDSPRMQQRYMNIDTTTEIIPLTSLPGSPGKFGNCQQTRENHVFQMFFRFYKLGPCATLYPDDVLFAAVIDIFDRIRRNEFTANYRFIVGLPLQGYRGRDENRTSSESARNRPSRAAVYEDRPDTSRNRGSRPAT